MPLELNIGFILNISLFKCGKLWWRKSWMIGHWMQWRISRDLFTNCLHLLRKGGKNWGTFKTLLWPFFCLKRFCLFNFLMWPKIFFSFKLTIYKHIASIHDIIRRYILKHYKVNGYFPKTKGIRHIFFSKVGFFYRRCKSAHGSLLNFWTT